LRAATRRQFSFFSVHSPSSSPVAGPMGTPDTRRTTLNFGPKFFYIDSLVPKKLGPWLCSSCSKAASAPHRFPITLTPAGRRQAASCCPAVMLTHSRTPAQVATRTRDSRAAERRRGLPGASAPVTPYAPGSRTSAPVICSRPAPVRLSPLLDPQAEAPSTRRRTAHGRAADTQAMSQRAAAAARPRHTTSTGELVSLIFSPNDQMAMALWFRDLILSRSVKLLLQKRSVYWYY